MHIPRVYGEHGGSPNADARLPDPRPLEVFQETSFVGFKFRLEPVERGYHQANRNEGQAAERGDTGAKAIIATVFNLQPVLLDLPIQSCFEMEKKQPPTSWRPNIELTALNAAFS